MDKTGGGPQYSSAVSIGPFAFVSVEYSVSWQGDQQWQCHDGSLLVCLALPIDKLSVISPNVL